MAPTALADDPTIIDLTQEFEIGNVNNPAAREFESVLTRDIRRFLVLEDGVVVVDYQRDTVEDDDVYNLWSATKAVMSVVMGTILTSDEYDLTMETTLGEVFTEERYWNEIEDEEELAFKQNITIYELMTMTSGLVSVLDTSLLSANPFKPFDVANSAGINIKESLSVPGWNTTLKGQFNYMPTSNILSYVIREVTGMTPREYCMVDLFPSLGIGPDDFEWDQNFGGVETSYSSLKMNARQMAKFAQLYLQKGKSSPDKQLLPESFVEESLSPILFAEMFNADYGYFWLGMHYNTTEEPSLPEDGEVWCGAGFLGQMFCFDYRLNRVVVAQRSNTLFDTENVGLIFFLTAATFSSDVSFEGNATTLAPTEAPPGATPAPSGAVSRSVSGALVVLALSCLAVLP